MRNRFDFFGAQYAFFYIRFINNICVIFIYLYRKVSSDIAVLVFENISQFRCQLGRCLQLVLKSLCLCVAHGKRHRWQCHDSLRLKINRRYHRDGWFIFIKVDAHVIYCNRSKNLSEKKIDVYLKEEVEEVGGNSGSHRAKYF